jgi:hypothetical protein
MFAAMRLASSRLSSLFTFIAEEIIVVRWWAYVIPVLIGLVGLLLFHDILRATQIVRSGVSKHVGMHEEREFRSHPRPGNHALISGYGQRRAPLRTSAI